MIGLLLGIAVLGLAAVPIPTPSSTTRRVQCFANLRQIIGATLLYAADNGDRMPYPGWGGGPSGPDGWAYATRLDGVAILSAAGRATNTLQLPFLRAGQLWPFLQKDAPFFCPEDMAHAQGAGASLWRQRDMKVTSFGMSSIVIRSGQLPGFRTLALNRFRPDGIAYLELEEALPFNFNDSGCQPLESPSQRHSPMPASLPDAPRTSGRSHIGTFGGAVEMMTIMEFKQLATGAPTPNRLWCEPDSPTGGR